jgi:secondary thiamine-phosphate synthase enzyme
MDQAKTLDAAERIAFNASSNGHYPDLAERAGTRVVGESIRLRTGEAPDFVDITERVERILADTGISQGFAVIFSKHTTAAVRVNENESCLKRDFAKVLERVAPCDAYYEHNDLTIRTENLVDNEDLNGHSHCIHMLMGASETVPVINGRLALGRWQRIFLIELDKARDREVIVQCLGV